MPRGGWLREVRRWACCGLRRTGGPSPGFGAFSSSPYTVPLCWVWGPGIAVLWSCQRIDVCDSVRLLYLLTYLRRAPEVRYLALLLRGTDHLLVGVRTAVTISSQ